MPRKEAAKKATKPEKVPCIKEDISYKGHSLKGMEARVLSEVRLGRRQKVREFFVELEKNVGGGSADGLGKKGHCIVVSESALSALPVGPAKLSFRDTRAIRSEPDDEVSGEDADAARNDIVFDSSARISMGSVNIPQAEQVYYSPTPQPADADLTDSPDRLDARIEVSAPSGRSYTHTGTFTTTTVASSSSADPELADLLITLHQRLPQRVRQNYLITYNTDVDVIAVTEMNTTRQWHLSEVSSIYADAPTVLRERITSAIESMRRDSQAHEPASPPDPLAEQIEPAMVNLLATARRGLSSELNLNCWTSYSAISDTINIRELTTGQEIQISGATPQYQNDPAALTERVRRVIETQADWSRNRSLRARMHGEFQGG